LVKGRRIFLLQILRTIYPNFTRLGLPRLLYLLEGLLLGWIGFIHSDLLILFLVNFQVGKLQVLSVKSVGLIYFGQIWARTWLVELPRLGNSFDYFPGKFLTFSLLGSFTDYFFLSFSI